MYSSQILPLNMLNSLGYNNFTGLLALFALCPGQNLINMRVLSQRKKKENKIMIMFSSKSIQIFYKLLTETFLKYLMMLMIIFATGITMNRYGLLTLRKFLKNLETTSINGKGFSIKLEITGKHLIIVRPKKYLVPS